MQIVLGFDAHTAIAAFMAVSSFPTPTSIYSFRYSFFLSLSNAMILLLAAFRTVVVQKGTIRQIYWAAFSETILVIPF
jgi:hypothetical protein